MERLFLDNCPQNILLAVEKLKKHFCITAGKIFSGLLKKLRNTGSQQKVSMLYVETYRRLFFQLHGKYSPGC
tara:strand:- start:1759 stop:1974 length:216 start_codon:yes stop_codon:yes gene_type:complete